PSAERALAVAAQDDHPHRRVGGKRLTRRDQVARQAVVDSVQRLGPIQNQVEEVPVGRGPLDQDSVAHPRLGGSVTLSASPWAVSGRLAGAWPSRLCSATTCSRMLCRRLLNRTG